MRRREPARRPAPRKKRKTMPPWKRFEIEFEPMDCSIPALSWWLN